MRAWITGVAVWGPGLPGWAASRAVLAGEQAFLPIDTPPPLPAILPATERRRTGVAVRLALAVAQQAMEMAGLAPGSIPSVFGSANGDSAVVHNILVALTAADVAGAAPTGNAPTGNAPTGNAPTGNAPTGDAPTGDAPAGQERLVSPTQFHNSVHNAAAGYWTIGTGSAAATTSLGCHDATFAAALLKAMAELHVERHPMLLCLYDAVLPEPLLARRPAGAPFAAAVVLTPEPTDAALAGIEVVFHPCRPDPGAEAPLQPGFRPLAMANAAARALRLLEHLARGQPGRIAASLLDGHLAIGVQPLHHPPC